VPGRAGDRAGGLVDEEVIAGESVLDDGAQWDRFDDRAMPGIGQGDAGLGGP
jgi:hypothetical protein